MTPVIAVFDVGKTNKKLFFFDRYYRIVWEQTDQLAETVDDDGDPCEDLARLTDWLLTTLGVVLTLQNFDIQAINVSAYGASLVCLDVSGQPVGPLQNYLKPFPDALRDQFYGQYGPANVLSRQTASPALDSLNSGLQLYRLKHEQPDLFADVHTVLHLPQYLSHLISHRNLSEPTSLGCHTLLWDFQKQDYHDWVKTEQLDNYFAPVVPSDHRMLTALGGKNRYVGVGLHDSSAALVPYLRQFGTAQPFVLLSTGTWCISLNPFNHDPLTASELAADCLCYLDVQGQPVKASRLFAGYEHEQQTRRLAAHFNRPDDYYKQIAYEPALLEKRTQPADNLPFSERNLAMFPDYETAYHQFMREMVARQVTATRLVLSDDLIRQPALSRIFVDGGFSQNPLYMNGLAKSFPGFNVYAASVAQATALGAALLLHEAWNPEPVPMDLITLGC